MSISNEFEIKLKNNQRTIFITDADDLLAVWQFKRKSSSKHSNNLSRVPQEWRYSAPPSERSPLMPCHISYRRKAVRSYSKVKPAYDYSTKNCHHSHGSNFTISLPDLESLMTDTN